MIMLPTLAQSLLNPSHALFKSDVNPLERMFHPKVVVAIGASEREGSVGRVTFENLIGSGFKGKVIPVNSQRTHVFGVPTKKHVLDIEETVDLAVIMTPPPSILGLIKDCIKKGIPAAIIISAGLKETGETGAKMEEAIVEAARGRIRLLGPNCLGMMNPGIGLNASFAATIARPGKVALLSQSGALCTAILDWSLKEHLGFSAFVSMGSMSDIGWGDLIDYFGEDPHTTSILIYMESVGDARHFLSAAREVALKKPIVVIKAGRTKEAAQAAASHTGALTGSDAVLDAAFERCGILRVDQISELFLMQDLLDKQPLPRGNRLAIVTNAGGPGVLAADALVSGGGALAELSDASKAALDEVLPKHWSHGNPIDVIGDADTRRYTDALSVVLKDEGVDGVLVIMTPQGMTKPLEIAKGLIRESKGYDKTILTSWMGASQVAAATEALSIGGFPNTAFPDNAAKAFNWMWRYDQQLQVIYEPPHTVKRTAVDRGAVQKLLQEPLNQGRLLLTEFESKRLLASYGIPTVETHLAQTMEEAVLAAKRMGYPVVLKLHSFTLTHKSDVGGVLLSLQNEEQVRGGFEKIRSNLIRFKGDDAAFQGVTVQRMAPLPEGYELILGASPDPQFGPVILFGTGGALVEVFKDSAVALPPLTTTGAKRLIRKTRIAQALKGVRGRAPVSENALAEIMVQFSDLILQHPEIAEMDLNPLLASERGLLALDARVVLHPPGCHRVESAIRPYPIQYVGKVTIQETPYVLRPIRPEDECAMVRFHERLSGETVESRYFSPIQLKDRIRHDRMIHVCHVDYDRDFALILEEEAKGEIRAVGRLRKSSFHLEGEMGILVEDACQRKGLGRYLGKHLLRVAKDEGWHRIVARMKGATPGMRRICQELGFQFRSCGEWTVVEHHIQNQHSGSV
jgi:acetyltransferase